MKTNLTKQIRSLHKGSSEGDIINTVTNNIYNGEEGVKVIPCAYQRRFIHWSPQGDDNTAPIAIYTTKEDCPKTERSKEDNKEYLTDNASMKMYTSYAIFYTSKNLVETDRDVTIITSDSTTTGSGLSANMDTGMIVILSLSLIHI